MAIRKTTPQTMQDGDIFKRLINENRSQVDNAMKEDLFARAQVSRSNEFSQTMDLKEKMFSSDQEYQAARLGLARQAVARAGEQMTPAQKEIARQARNASDIESGFKRDWRKGTKYKADGGSNYTTTEAYIQGDMDTKIRMDAVAAKLTSDGYTKKDVNNYIQNKSEQNMWGTRWLQGNIDFN